MHHMAKYFPILSVGLLSFTIQIRGKPFKSYLINIKLAHDWIKKNNYFNAVNFWTSVVQTLGWMLIFQGIGIITCLHQQVTRFGWGLNCIVFAIVMGMLKCQDTGLEKKRLGQRGRCWVVPAAKVNLLQILQVWSISWIHIVYCKLVFALKATTWLTG